jgi:MFS superfamily sulfate permease-like transporter
MACLATLVVTALHDLLAGIAIGLAIAIAAGAIRNIMARR